MFPAVANSKLSITDVLRIHWVSLAWLGTLHSSYWLGHILCLSSWLGEEVNPDHQVDVGVTGMTSPFYWNSS